MEREDKRMNILYIAPFTGTEFLREFGGLESSGLACTRKVGLIGRELAAQGHQVQILSSYMLSNRAMGWRKEMTEQLSESCRVLYPGAWMLRPLGSVLNWMRADHILRGVVSSFKPDAVIVYNTYVFESICTKILLRRIGNLPVVLEIEDMPLARQRGRLNVKPRLDQMCWKAMVEAASAFTAVNQTILDELPLDKKKVLLPSALDPTILQSAAERRRAFSRPGTRMVGYFGGLTEDKGVGVLIETVPQLPRGWKMLVSGSGPLATSFASMSKSFPDRLQFLGRVEDLELCRAMVECDCTVIPRERIDRPGESVFPFKAFEYIMSGSHLIACNLPSACDVDLSFVRRFDGTAAGLLAALATAEEDFSTCEEARERAIAGIASRYGVSAVAKTLTRMIAGAGADIALPQSAWQAETRTSGRDGDLAGTSSR